MKTFTISIILSLMMSAYGVESYGSTIVGDVIIQTRNGTLYCDSLICPPDATSCQVTKRNSRNDFSQIVRNRKCFGPDGEILSQETKYEPNPYGQSVNINIVSGGGGSVRELTPEEQRELEETLSETNRRIQEQLRPFQDGTFQRDLENSIRETLKNALRF